MDRKPRKTIVSDMPLLEGTDVAMPATLEKAREAAKLCTRCPLYMLGTQTVFGEGPPKAQIMFVGEQPGDKEDLAGRPFVGPAGRLFDTLLQEAGLDRAKCYVTNAVKHFKFEPRGKRRIHQKPNAAEVDACRWWLAEEIRLVRPRLIVALGATGALGVTGRSLPVQASRGVVLPADRWPDDPARSAAPRSRRPDLLVTVHPSYLLRLQSQEDKRREWRAFLADLSLAAAHAAKLAATETATA
jgi:DNA polymerase